MIMPLCVLLSAVIGVCWFGSFKNFTSVDIRFLWCPVAAALAEFSMLPLWKLFGAGFKSWAFAPLVLSYALLFLFLFSNLRLRGTLLMAAGAGANFAVIAANGFLMPVASVPASGMTEFQSLRYVLMTDGARLPFLAGALRLPLPLIGGYASVGDLLLAAGASVFLINIMRPQGGYFTGIRKI